MSYVCDDNYDCEDGYDEDREVCTAGRFFSRTQSPILAELPICKSCLYLIRAEDFTLTVGRCRFVKVGWELSAYMTIK